jgi:hypothetical protein
MNVPVAVVAVTAVLLAWSCQALADDVTLSSLLVFCQARRFHLLVPASRTGRTAAETHEDPILPGYLPFRWKLRAATSLARLWAGRCERQKALGRLLPLQHVTDGSQNPVPTRPAWMRDPPS